MLAVPGGETRKCRRSLAPWHGFADCSDQPGNSKLGQIRETINVNLCFLKFPPTVFQCTFKIRRCEELRIFYTSWLVTRERQDKSFHITPLLLWCMYPLYSLNILMTFLYTNLARVCRETWETVTVKRKTKNLPIGESKMQILKSHQTSSFS